MAVMGFSIDPGGFPIRTVRDKKKWEPRLANGMIEIRGEGACKMPQQMARVVSVKPITWDRAVCDGLYVPGVYGPWTTLILVELDLP